MSQNNLNNRPSCGF